jgi:hypothetical protein
VVRYVVEHVAKVENADEFWPFIKPEYEGVTVGTASPYIAVCEEAVTVISFLVTLTAPAT